MLSFIHEGHGEPGQGHTIAHYLTEPVHVVGIVVAAAILIGIWWMAGRRLPWLVSRRESGRDS